MVDQIKLAALLTEPQRVSPDDATLLEDFVKLYPYFQPLHLLLAKANINQREEKDFLATAALHTNGLLLHKVLFESEHLDTVKDDLVKDDLPVESQEISQKSSFPESIDDEEEIFEEIGEVNLNDFLKSETIEDNIVLENIVANDFFAFEQKFTPDTFSEQVPEQALAKIDTEKKEPEEDNRISNYHDEKLPYTFLWWLEKTRKEHQTIFQPYAAPKRQAANDLQQQYVENIFHIQSPFNPEEILNNTPEVAHADPKEVEILDNFIRNAPQIGTLKAEQIDNENKARKSAEDHYDLVTETLAKIYIEQMLYHKAIETYEKLSLKFPEKSRYFGDLIQSIKKKI